MSMETIMDMSTIMVLTLAWFVGAIINTGVILYVIWKKHCTFQDWIDYAISAIFVAGSLVIDVVFVLAYVCSYIEWYLTDRRR